MSYIHYPQDTGSEKVDRVIKSWMEKHYALPDTGFGYPPSELRTYLIGRPSPRYISIAFCDQWYGTENRYSQIWFVYNYDLETGRALTLTDVFPDMEHSEALL